MTKEFKNTNALVCGVRFGKFYVEALKYNNINVKAILCRGSDSSKIYAEKLGIEVYTEIDQVNLDNIDLACISIKSSIMGGEGTKIALRILESGIPVVIEQPIHYKDIIESTKVALKNDTMFFVGNLYNNLPSVKEYIKNFEKITANENPLYVEIKLATQVSYPVASILSNLLSSDITYNAVKVNIGQGISLFKCEAKKIPIIMLADNRIDLSNIDGHLPIFFQINTSFNSGTLILQEAFGRTNWLPAMYIEEDRNYNENNKLGILKTNNLYDKTTVMLSENIEENSFEFVFENIWVESIAEDLKFFLNCVRERNVSSYNSYINNEIKISKLWKMIMEVLGYPEIKKNKIYKRLEIENMH